MHEWSRSALGVVVLLAAASLRVDTALACHCDIPNPREALDRSEATFACEILEVALDSLGTFGYDRATARVEQCWKGSLGVGQVIQVRTPSCIGCCGQGFGGHMVLFTSVLRSDVFYTDFCYGNTVPVPSVLEALGPSGCEVNIEQQPWGRVKRLYE